LGFAAQRTLRAGAVHAHLLRPVVPAQDALLSIAASA